MKKGFIFSTIITLTVIAAAGISFFWWQNSPQMVRQRIINEKLKEEESNQALYQPLVYDVSSKNIFIDAKKKCGLQKFFYPVYLKDFKVEQDNVCEDITPKTIMLAFSKEPGSYPTISFTVLEDGGIDQHFYTKVDKVASPFGELDIYTNLTRGVNQTEYTVNWNMGGRSFSITAINVSLSDYKKFIQSLVII